MQGSMLPSFTVRWEEVSTALSLSFSCWTIVYTSLKWSVCSWLLSSSWLGMKTDEDFRKKCIISTHLICNVSTWQLLNVNASLTWRWVWHASQFITFEDMLLHLTPLQPAILSVATIRQDLLWAKRECWMEISYYYNIISCMEARLGKDELNMS